MKMIAVCLVSKQQVAALLAAYSAELKHRVSINPTSKGQGAGLSLLVDLRDAPDCFWRLLEGTSKYEFWAVSQSEFAQTVCLFAAPDPVCHLSLIC
ncbi:hypothetical protein [Rhodoferax sp. BLA1]|uniref:hypothetical protein n=1 Tax=Rhodoferax sp. BLA1 TaxID=2576062 RepID=UPI0015D1A58D|nr:hypothetical protein [Rhodoferax sp. BLA1]